MPFSLSATPPGVGFFLLISDAPIPRYSLLKTADRFRSAAEVSSKAFSQDLKETASFRP